MSNSVSFHKAVFSALKGTHFYILYLILCSRLVIVVFYYILKFNFITSLMICLKSRSNIVAYFYAGNDPLFAVAQWIEHLYYDCTILRR